MKNERYEFAKYEKHAQEHDEKVFSFSGIIHGSFPYGDGTRGDMRVSGHLTAKSVDDAKRQLRKRYKQKYKNAQEMQFWVKEIKK